MNFINLTLKENQCRPLQWLAGEVSWQLDKTPKSLTLRLFWFTQGRGTEDIYLAEERELTTAQQGETSFSLYLPAGPYSFSGKLISLTWCVEVFSNQESIFASKEFTLSPTGEEIFLDYSDT